MNQAASHPAERKLLLRVVEKERQKGDETRRLLTETGLFQAKSSSFGGRLGSIK